MDVSPGHISLLEAESKQSLAYGIIISFTTLAFLFVSLRFATRILIIRNPGAEDVLIGVAMAASATMAACMVKQIQNGAGRHQAFVTLEEIEESLKFLYGSIISYAVCGTAFKLSILLQYRRLFPGKKVHKVLTVAMAITGAYGVEIFLSGLLTCVPIQAFWTIRLKKTAICLPQFPLWYINAGINILTDLMIATLPLPIIFKLKAANKHKIALSVMFGIGWIACAISVLRLHSITVLNANFHDMTWYSPEPAYWSCMESNIGIICASLPTLKPLLHRVIPRLFPSSDRSPVGNGGVLTSRRTTQRASAYLDKRASVGPLQRGYLPGESVLIVTVPENDEEAAIGGTNSVSAVEASMGISTNAAGVAKPSEGYATTRVFPGQ